MPLTWLSVRAASIRPELAAARLEALATADYLGAPGGATRARARTRAAKPARKPSRKKAVKRGAKAKTARKATRKRKAVGATRRPKRR